MSYPEVVQPYKLPTAPPPPYNIAGTGPGTKLYGGFTAPSPGGVSGMTIIDSDGVNNDGNVLELVDGIAGLNAQRHSIGETWTKPFVCKYGLRVTVVSGNCYIRAAFMNDPHHARRISRPA